MEFQNKNGNAKKAEKASDNTNIVYLAGTIEGMWENDKGAFLLVDPGNTSGKFVPCTLFGDTDRLLIEKIGQFEKGDSIKLVGFVRPWSQKVGGKWENKCEIRITEIKNDPPQERSSGRASVARSMNDDIPF